MNSIRINSRFTLYLAFLFYGMSSCSEEDGIVSQVPIDQAVQLNDLLIVNPYSVLPNYAYTLTQRNIQRIPGNREMRKLLEAAVNDVSVHRFIYKTTYKGEQIDASGVICLPLHVNEEPPLLSFHHGTLTSKLDAPSLASDSTSSSFGILPGIIFASRGFITLIPDYIGYGASSTYFHPYLIYEPTVTAVIDMIKEGKFFLRENDIPFREDKLLLAGYSEGGYVTLAVQKEIETFPEHGLTVTASAPGGGPYDLAYGLDLVVQRKNYGWPSLVGFAITAYNDFYWKEPLDHFFTEPYASRAQWIFESDLRIEEVDRELTTSIDHLFNTDLLADLRSNKDTPLADVAKMNSVHNWTPRSPTRLWHGKEDDAVFYDNARKAFDDMIANGTDPGLVKLISVDDAGHEGGRWMVDVLTWLNGFR